MALVCGTASLSPSLCLSLLRTQSLTAQQRQTTSVATFHFGLYLA